MAAVTSSLIVSLIDHVTAPARAVSSAIIQITEQQTRVSRHLNDMRGKMFDAAAVGYTLQKALSAPIKSATEFETKLVDISQKIDAPLSGLKQLGSEIRQVGEQTNQSSGQMADAMDILVGMGAEKSDALTLLPAIGRAATAYGAEISDLANAGYSSLTNLKVPADQFSKALDAMAQAGKDGAFELKDMAQYFPTLGAAYEALGQKGVPAVADLAAALQVARKATGDSSTAANNIVNVLQKIRAPQTIKAFSNLGVDLEASLKSATQKGMTPLEAIADITSKTLKGDLSHIGDIFQDLQVQNGLRPLIQNIQEYKKIRADAGSAAGVVDKDFAERMQTAAAIQDRFNNSLENTKIALGNSLLPAFSNILDAITPYLRTLRQITDAHPRLTAALIGTTGALVGLRVAAIASRYGMAWMWSGALGAASLGMRGLGRAAIIVTAPVRGLRAAWAGMRTVMIGMLGAGAIGRAGESFRALLNPIRLVSSALRVLRVALIGTGIGAALVALAAAGIWIYNNWHGLTVLFEGFGSAFSKALGPAAGVLSPLIDGIKSVWTWINNLLGPLKTSDAQWKSWGETLGTVVGGAVSKVITLISSLFGWMGSLYEKAKAFAGLGSGGAAAPGPAAVAGARAAGGDVAAGLTYLVGERGPELVTFPKSGVVTPAGPTAAALSGGGRDGGSNTFNVTINAKSGQSPMDIARAVEQALSRKLTGKYSAAFTDGVI